MTTASWVGSVFARLTGSLLTASWVGNVFSPSATIGPVIVESSLVYTPTRQWDQRFQYASVPRGSDVSITFAPATPTAIDSNQFEVRIGAIGATPVVFSSALGNLVAGEDVGTLRIVWTAAITSSIRTNTPITADVIRVAPDGSRTLVGRAKVIVYDTR